MVLILIIMVLELQLKLIMIRFCKVKVKNDTKCAATAEHMFGCCQADNNVLFLTLGTGIGGAYIYQGNLMTGSIFEGFEFGHMIIRENGLECKCGKKGCFEKYASMKAFKTNLRNALSIDEKTSGKELFNILRENKQGNKNYDIIENVVIEFIQNLAIGISNLINIFEPEMIGIGGSFVFFEEVLLDRLKKEIITTNLLFNQRKDIDIKTATLGNDAGIIGAVL